MNSYTSPFQLDPNNPPPHYNLTATYATEEEGNQLITDLINKLTDLYTRFLTPEGHQNLHPGMWFFGEIKTYPTPEHVELFRTNLRQAMSNVLLKKAEESEYKRDYFQLSTDYTPEKEFSEVAYASHIATYRDYQRFFPSKTHTYIDRNFKDKQIRIHVQLEGPPF